MSIKGVEGELLLKPVAGLTIAGQFGYTKGKYEKILFDLNADGVINDRDFALKLPRLSPWSYGGSITYATAIGGDFDAEARVGANHRDAAFYNDQNTGLLRAATMVDASLAVTHGRQSIVLRQQFAQRSDVSEPKHRCPSPPIDLLAAQQGRVYGVEVGYKF